MIITFSVQNFRSIREKITLDFNASSDKHHEEYFVYEIPKPKLRILRLAMIYGANASGKTNILKALDFLRRLVLSTVSDKDDLINYLPFALDGAKPSIFEIEFCHGEVVYSYSVELNAERILSERLDYYPKGRTANVFRRSYNSQKDAYEYKWTYRGYNKAVQDRLELSIRNQLILSTIASIDALGPIQKARDWFKDSLLPMQGSQYQFTSIVFDAISANKISREFALSMMKTADLMISDYTLNEREWPAESYSSLYSYRRSVDISDGRATLTKLELLIEHSVEDGRFHLEFSDQSYGTQRYFGFVALLNELIQKSVTLPVDEIDSSLHHDLVMHFLYMFLKNSKKGQLIFTTHNLSLLGEKDIARRDCIWITDRKPDGSTELSSVWDYPVRKEHSIESLYRKGFLGGKPFLGSTDIEVNDD